MSAPRVSVLLPCRDAADTLPEAARSLERQTLREFEVVAVDDGSRDETGDVLREWARGDARVRVLKSGGDGLVPALRLAASEARAPLLARMDADDVAHPRRLERQVAFLEERREAACGSGVVLFPRGRLGSGLRRYERWINGLHTPAEVARDLLVECPVAHPTLVIRRSALRAVGGYRDRGWPEDWDLLLRLHLAGMRAANVPERLLLWRHHPERLSFTAGEYSRDAFARCRVHYLLAGHLPPDRPVLVWGAGRVGKTFVREMRRQGRTPDAFVDVDPRKVGEEIHGLPVHPPPFLEEEPEAYVLAAVGSPGARREIRGHLRGLGRREPADFRAVA